MEIKQGDKVKVSEDAPKVYLSSVNNLFKYHVCKVEETDGDSAKIRYLDIGIDRWLAIPTKYLVKVDAGVKEAKFKVGDKVIVHYPTGDSIGRIQEVMLDGTYDIDYGGGCTGHNITRSQIEPYTAPKYKVGNWVMISGVLNPQLNGMIGWISRIDKDGNKVSFQDGRFAIVEDKYLTLITQPTEQTEAKETFDDQIRDVLNGVEHQDFGRPIQTAMINLDINDWDAYAADLAKEIVLKTVNSASDRRPSVIAEYATDVAKAVVEGLKRK